MKYFFRSTAATGALALALCLLVLLSPPVSAQILQHPDPHLESVYPAGGQQGQRITIDLRGEGALLNAAGLLIDGPPGITFSDVKAESGHVAKAMLTIAPDASPGRRRLRVQGGQTGLTNFRYFFVSGLPERLEMEQNNQLDQAEAVTLPIVMNARIQRALDVDCFRFAAKAGQKLVAAVIAHGLDGFVDRAGTGFLDTGLELLDDKGTVLAANEDAIGVDPLIEFAIPADGNYTVRVKTFDYKGAEKAVYRLLIGELPVATAVFPVSVPLEASGAAAEVELFGPNIPPGTKVTLPPCDPKLPIQYLGHPATAGVMEVPVLRAAGPHAVEAEPNNAAAQAQATSIPHRISGRFDAAGDEDWFRVKLEKDQGIVVQTIAQRQLRSPVDTVLEICDATGKKIVDNDDGRGFGAGVRASHDFFSTDSWLPFTAPAAGEYTIRVRDQSGAEGPRAVYCLSITPLEPEFELHVWPDAVPVWGAGSTAAVVVEAVQWGGVDQDMEIAIEGLPEGWQGSKTNWPASYYRGYGEGYTLKHLLTITAPASAAQETVAPFRVVGRTKVIDKAGNEKTIEREAIYFTLYGNSHNDGMIYRRSDIARAAVATPLDAVLATPAKEITVVKGSVAEIPVSISRSEGKSGPIGLVVNGPTVAVGVGWQPPVSLTGAEREFTVKLPTAEILPGTYGITVSRAWSSDLRGGRPGPCTPIIMLKVVPEK